MSLSLLSLSLSFYSSFFPLNFINFFVVYLMIENQFELLKPTLQGSYLEGIRTQIGGITQKVKSWYWGRPLVSLENVVKCNFSLFYMFLNLEL